MNKEQLLKEHLDKPYEVGEVVYVKGLGTQNKNSWFYSTKIVELADDGVYIKEYSNKTFVPFENIRKVTYNIGYNPFPPKNHNEPRAVNYTFESILFQFSEKNKGYKTENGEHINEYSFDPYVEIDGVKHYYQRGLVWTLEQKQNLIESIYNGVNCGSILVRKRSYNWNYKQTKSEDTSFLDVVDGKQRLTTMLDFINNKFPDANGVYYRDFSENAQRRLTDHQLFNYAEFGEDATDEDVIRQFLKVNFTGVPQSKEHIDYVKSLYDKF